MRRPLVLLVLLVVTVVPAGCDAGDSDLVSSLCTAVRAADDGEVDEARDIFDDNHAALHALADDLSDSDRQRAAELLRAKQEVEREAGAAAGGRLADLLRDLATAAASATGDDPPSCA